MFKGDYQGLLDGQLQGLYEGNSLGLANGLMLGGSGVPKIVLQDTFKIGSVIDTLKWTVTDPAGDGTSVAQVNNTGLVFTNLHTSVGVLVQAFVKSVAYISSNSKYAIAQSNLSWTNAVINGASCGMSIFFDANNSTTINTRANIANTYRFSITKGGVTVYDVTSFGVAQIKDIKTTYNFLTKEIKFWYWNNAGWNQMGTTQIFNLDNNNPAFIRFNSADQSTFTGVTTATFKDAFLSNDEYLGQYPF